MSQLPSADQSNRPASSTDVPAVEPGLEVVIQAFWDKHHKTIYLVCAAALAAIVGREGWQYYSARHEKSVRAEYAKVADRTDQLAAFAAANASHALAGVAYLQIADGNYAAADFKQAAANYQKAAGSLRNEVLLGRAKLGAAMSLLNGGDKAAGEAALKSLTAEQSLNKGVRAEASYHLASLSVEAGKTVEAKKFAEEVDKIDPSGPWSQRATLLLASLQTGSTAPAPDPKAPSVTFKPGGE